MPAAPGLLRGRRQAVEPPRNAATRRTENRRTRLLDLDLGKPQAVPVTGLWCGELGQGLDGHDHVLRGDGFSQRHGEVR